MAKQLVKDHLDLNGMMNKGNTCFFNSTMQCIISIPKIVQHFLYTPFEENQPVSLALQNFLYNYKNSKIVDPSDFIRSISRKIKLFNGKQQDAHSFLESFMTLLESEDKSNFMKNNFEIEIEDTIRCHSCGFSSKNISSTLIQYLFIKKSISESINSFVSEEEVIDSGSPYECPSCKQRNKASISHNITKSNMLVVILLNRFLNQDEKNNKETDISGSITICNKHYELVGVVNHVGGLGSGHYFSYAKRDDWREFNDSTVSRTSKPATSGHAYILFYTLKN